jgi:hypothetical protein
MTHFTSTLFFQSTFLALLIVLLIFHKTLVESSTR